MKLFTFRIDILRDCFVKVKANNEEEAKEKIKDIDNWVDEPERNKEEIWFQSAIIYNEKELEE